MQNSCEWTEITSRRQSPVLVSTLSRGIHPFRAVSLQYLTSRLGLTSRSGFKTNPMDTGDGYKKEEFSFTNKRDQNIHCYEYTPVGPVKAVLVFQHGYAEHSGRKAYAFRKFADAGVAVFAADMHGFGRSEPLTADGRALVWDYNHSVDDLEQFCGICHERYAASGLASCPTWLIGGYSWGAVVSGLAALRSSSDSAQPWAGIVWVSPCLGIHTTWLTNLQRRIAPVLLYLVPTSKIVQPVELHTLTTDEEEIEDYRKDPLAYQDYTRIKTGWAMHLSMEDLKARKKKLQLPMFVMHATGDLLTPFRDTKKFVGEVGQPDRVKFYPIEGRFHNILSGSDQGKYVDAMLEWMLGMAAGRELN